MNWEASAPKRTTAGTETVRTSVAGLGPSTVGVTRAWIGLAVAASLVAASLGTASAEGTDRSQTGAGDALGFVATHAFRLTSPVSAIASDGGKRVALLEDGTVVRLDLDGPVLIGSIGPGHPGTLVPCGGTTWVVDSRGLLVGMPDVRGPEVSLHATPLCVGDGHLFAIDPYGWTSMLVDPHGSVTTRADLETVPDVAPVRLGDGAIALLTGPTSAYPHGVLGDEIEASGVAVVDPSTLEVLATWTAPEGRVVEQRSVTPWPAAGRYGMLLTISGGGDGGALVVLAATRPRDPAATLGVRVAALGLGAEGRWRHTLPVAGVRAYSVATPHVGGVLERWTLAATDVARDPEPAAPDGLEAGVLDRTAFDQQVASHRIGERRLGWAVLVDRADGDAPAVDALLLPRADRRTFRLVACGPAGCREAARFALPVPASSEPSVRRGPTGFVEVWIGDETGTVRRFAWAGDLAAPAAE